MNGGGPPIDLREAIASNKIEVAMGEAEATIEAFAMFDRFDPTGNHLIPPLED